MPKLSDLPVCELEEEYVRHGESENFVPVFKFDIKSKFLSLTMVYGTLNRKFFIYDETSNRFSKCLPYYEARSMLWQWRSQGEFYNAAKPLGMYTRRNVSKILWAVRNWFSKQGDPDPGFSTGTITVLVTGIALLFLVPTVFLVYPITSFCALGIFFIWGFIV